jgi:hypothetical protein
MIRLAELWRSRLRVWLPALLFFVVNLALLLAHRLAISGWEGALAGRLSRAETRIERLETEHRHLEGLLSDAERARTDIATVYADTLGVEAERLTAMMAEVKSLARRAGMQPEVISYPREELHGYGLRKKSFVFGVEGSYQELRRFINLLEVTPSFLVLEEIGLQEGGGSGVELQISLRLSTYFASDGDAEPPRVST